MKPWTSLVVLCALGVPAGTSAAINIDTVPVCDPGNAGEWSAEGTVTPFPGRICGGVSYVYEIGKYEVTAGQYAAFLNSVAARDTYGLYNSLMWTSGYGCKIQRSGQSGWFSYSVAPDYANRPVNYVSYWDAVRFANWLHNGQPVGGQGAGTTETGAYAIDGYHGIDGEFVERIQRNSDWRWAVPSEDEWYKAAYYNPATGSYYDYPTSSDTAPGREVADASGNNANYWDGSGSFPIASGRYTTVVGQFQNSCSPYGTFDQGGNVKEWNEAIVGRDSSYPLRGIRGGSFYDGNLGAMPLQASYRSYHANYSTYEYHSIGFRVVQIPEPTSASLIAIGLLAAFRTRRRLRAVCR